MKILSNINIQISIFLIAILLGCTSPIDYGPQINELNGMDAKAAIAQANQWRYSLTKVTSYVTPFDLIVDFPDNREIKKQLPADTMYIAVAPYITFTHTCATHYISSCQGELSNKTFQVTAKDSTTGSIYIDSSMTALNNGFIELWLPRNKTIQLHITYNNLTTDGIITTTDNSNTCITTMKLE